MELNIVEDKKTKLVFELGGADHTICNLLKTELYNDKDVKVATFRIRHPLLRVPRFTIEATNPKKSLMDAVVRIEKLGKEFQTKFKKAA